MAYKIVSVNSDTTYRHDIWLDNEELVKRILVEPFMVQPLELVSCNGYCLKANST
jgi:hypothetical protein